MEVEVWVLIQDGSVSLLAICLRLSNMAGIVDVRVVRSRVLRRIDENGLVKMAVDCGSCILVE